MFELLREDQATAARRGRLHLGRATIETPVFMPVGTQATVKAMTAEEVWGLGYRLILANTYHLYLRPGAELVQQAGGIHRFMAWDGAVLTDSGGYQVFSLRDLRRVGEEGVRFRSHLDGTEHLFTPERVIAVEEQIGADIIMAFDECPPYPATHDYARESMQRTHAWARRCKDAHTTDTLLFGIVQGSTYADLRRESAEFIASLDFPGNALGGISVGEPREAMLEAVEVAAPLLPAHKPRYLMGVGMPLDILDAVARGMDLFDCVLPTRMGRNGTAFTTYGRANIKGARYREEFGPIDPECPCAVCQRYSAAYLRHLYKAGEILAARLLTYHNLAFYARLMEGIRAALDAGRFSAFRQEFERCYTQGDDDGDSGTAGAGQPHS